MMKTFALYTYLAVSWLSEPLWKRHLKTRIQRGKEDADRLNERLARDLAPRPNGSLVWFHALGIGEALALIAPIRSLRQARPDIAILLTTGTRTAAEGLARLGLPEGVIHQYAPVDAPGPIRRFLDHWKPDGFVLTELDLWPRMLTTLASRGIPMVLVNARLTDRRFGHRKKLRGLYAPLWGLFRKILVQDQLSVARMGELGADPARVDCAGLLKAASAPLPDLPDVRAEVQGAIGTRPVWVAASTQARELGMILQAHAKMRAASPDLMLVLAPRSPSDAPRIAELTERMFGVPAPQRSLGQLPETYDAVFICDSMGEMGLVYRLSPVAFIGHSLPVDGNPPLTGKNPFEAAALGRMVVHGPNIGNFAESYDLLRGCNACEEVADASALAQLIPKLLSDGEKTVRRGSDGQAELARAAQALSLTEQAIALVVPPAAGL